MTRWEINFTGAEGEHTYCAHAESLPKAKEQLADVLSKKAEDEQQKCWRLMDAADELRRQ